MIWSNLSDIARQIDTMEKAIFKDIGDTIAEGIWEEFETLVQETPQWTGTTAASWNLSMGGDSSVREQPKRTRQEALQKGHQAAVSIAVNHNYGKLDEITKQYRYRAIVVENNAEGADTSEGGPLRDVNKPSGAMARFEQRVANKIFEPVRNREL